MSGYNFDGGFDSDWENSGFIAWNEHDWQQYLKRTESEQKRFLKHFNKLKFVPNHLDEIARRLGWESEDWMPAAPDSEPGDDDMADGFESLLENCEKPSENSDPYTIHRHPVYIVTHGLYLHLLKIWERFLQNNIQGVFPKLLTDYSASLHAGEMNALMAMNSLDMGDFNLAICHLKNALSAVNHTMGIVQRLGASDPGELYAFQTEVMTCCFDLREVWLRLLRECRIEADRDIDVDNDE